jgi:hypothetical protein
MVEKGTLIRYLCVKMGRKREPLTSGIFFQFFLLSLIYTFCEALPWHNMETDSV